MISTASIAKHPLHPMLIPFPIALWVFSLICDILGFWTGNTLWSTFALYTIEAGIIGAVVAALPGFVDLFTMHASMVKRIGYWHMGINATVLVLYVVNFLWRRSLPVGMEVWQVLLSLVSVGLLSVSGWLGGEMVYVHGAGVEPVDRQKL